MSQRFGSWRRKEHRPVNLLVASLTRLSFCLQPHIFPTDTGRLMSLLFTMMIVYRLSFLFACLSFPRSCQSFQNTDLSSPRPSTSAPVFAFKKTVVPRTVPITEHWSIRVFEWQRTAAVVETYWQVQNGLSFTREAVPFGGKKERPLLDPFGLVNWPGSVVAAQEMLEYKHLIQDKRVLILGAGVGVEAIAAGILGAQSVIATDVHPTTLQLVECGVKENDLTGVIRTQKLDIASVESLPDCDVMVISDVLYNKDLADHVIRRCIEARRSSNPPTILISDSQRIVADFAEKLNEKLEKLGESRVYWMSRFLQKFTGSGVAIDEDQTYSVRARALWVGLEEDVASSWYEHESNIRKKLQRDEDSQIETS